MTKTGIYVVIATRQRPVLLEAALLALANCIKPPNFLGVEVVENGPPAQTHQVCARFQASLKLEYHYLSEGNKSSAYNLVLEKLGDCLVYFVDDDIEVSQDSLLALSETSAQEAKNFFFGGPLEVKYDIEPPSWLVSYLPASARGWHLDYHVRPGVYDGEFLGGNWAAYTEHLKMIGGFDSSVGPGQSISGQDSAAQEKLRRAGIYGFYIPSLRATHYVPPDRCSPSWAIARVYRTHIFYGTNTKGIRHRFNTFFRALLKIFRSTYRWYAYRIQSDFIKAYNEQFIICSQLGLLQGLFMTILIPRLQSGKRNKHKSE